MAISQATIRSRFKRRIRADLATASLSTPDVHNDFIDNIAQEATAEIIRLLASKQPFNATHFPSLVTSDDSLTFSSGSVALPATYQWYVALKVTSAYTDKDGDTQTLTDRFCRITTDPSEFARFDSASFLTTPTGKKPLALISDKVYVKPTTITAGKLTYVKTHPALSSNNTAFDDLGDNLLILHILKEYYAFRELDEFVAKVKTEIGELVSIGRAA